MKAPITFSKLSCIMFIVHGEIIFENLIACDSGTARWKNFVPVSDASLFARETFVSVCK